MNVGCAAYGQFLKAKDRSVDSAEDTDKKTFEPTKPTRLLLLALSDGRTDTQAMEYEHLQQLRVDTPPGTKVDYSEHGMGPMHVVGPLEISRMLSANDMNC